MTLADSAQHRPWRAALHGLLWLALLAIAAPVALAQSGAAPAAKGAPGPELIAVLDLEAVGASASEATALTERLREVLLKTGRFVVVDRSQMQAVLNEQALQQTGCTSQECAVKVGQILGVRKIISGKAIKVDGDIWLLSALMVDVETAQTLRAESLRFKGEFFDLLDQRVPALAEHLASPPGAVTAAAAATSASAAPPVTKAGALKVAIFPSLLEGEFTRSLERGHRAFVDRAVNVLHLAEPPLEVTQSFYPVAADPEAYQRFKRQPAFLDVQQKAWTGFFSRSPDESYVYRVARELGADVVIMQHSRADRTLRQFEVYALDVRNLRIYRREGTWEPPGGGITGSNSPNVVPAIVDESSWAVRLQTALADAVHELLGNR